jgi:glycosyltransferase involved in cell wall biosynthesis
MILFLLQYGDRRRGGIQYTIHLHGYLKQKFEFVFPENYHNQINRPKGILAHAIHSLKLVRNLKPKVVITDISSGMRDILAVWKAKKQGSRILIIVQAERLTYRLGNNGLVKKLIQACELYLLRSAAIILTNSQHMAKFIRSKNVKATIIINNPGMQIDRIPMEKPENRTFTLSNPCTILTVGEWTEPIKGVEYLFQALSLLDSSAIRVKLVGGYSQNSPHYRYLMDIIKSNNLEAKIDIQGFMGSDKIAEYYKIADIFVLPSLSEGYGMVLAEAMAFGLPIIACNIAAIPELIEDGVNGILVEPKNSKAIASAIRNLYDNPEIRLKISQSNIDAAHSLPTWNDFEAKLEKELLPILANMVD